MHDYSGRERSGEKTRRTENATRRQAAARSARTSLNQLHRSFLSFFLSFLVGTCVPRCPANQAGQPFAGSLVANVNSDEISLAIPLRSDDDLSILLEFAIHSFHRYQYHERNIQIENFPRIPLVKLSHTISQNTKATINLNLSTHRNTVVYISLFVNRPALDR